jgi:hypothetical protein
VKLHDLAPGDRFQFRGQRPDIYEAAGDATYRLLGHFQQGEPYWICLGRRFNVDRSIPCSIERCEEHKPATRKGRPDRAVRLVRTEETS